MITVEQFVKKQDFQKLLTDILNPLKPYYSEGKANLLIGSTSAAYEDKTAPMEAFARPLWGLIPFFFGGGESKEFEEIYREGLRSGTNPKSKEFWGGFRDYDQRFVEMAAIATGLLMIPDKLWEPLSDAEKDNLVNWLAGINEYTLPEGNWLFFNVLVNTALRTLGRCYSKDRLEYGLSRMEDFYLGDGWYEDGPGHHKDYYTSFAIHYYSLIYAVAMEKEEPERCNKFKQRSELFAKEFIYWFADNGEALPYGRSLTYRFAQVSFFSACLYAGVQPFSTGIMKGIIVRNLVRWMNSPIFDNAGILTIGYKYANLLMSENYNAPGSPYWCMKAFLFLALPEEHEFWSVQAQPLPVLDTIKILPKAEMIISRHSGEVTAYVSGKHVQPMLGHLDEKYSKFAYSTLFGFSVGRSDKGLEEAAPDSMLVFEIGGHYFTRRISKEFAIINGTIRSTWEPFEGIIVETVISPTKEGHTRQHRIESTINCKAYDCGFSVSMNDNIYYEKTDEPEHSAIIKNTFFGCKITGSAGKGIIISADPNTNLLYSKTKIPAVCYTIPKGRSLIESTIIEFIGNYQ